MVKKDKVKRGGVMKTWVSVVEGYRPAPGAPPKQRVIQAFGYLEEQEDPAAFLRTVEEFNENYRNENVPLKINADQTAKMYSEENRRQNYGYKFLEAIYDKLSIDSFERNRYRGGLRRNPRQPWSASKFLENIANHQKSP